MSRVECSDFSSGMNQTLAIFDAARAPGTQPSTSKVKHKPKARALTLNDAYKMMADLNNKSMLLRWLRMLVKQYCGHGMEYSLRRKWKPSDVDCVVPL